MNTFGKVVMEPWLKYHVWVDNPEKHLLFTGWALIWRYTLCILYIFVRYGKVLSGHR